MRRYSRRTRWFHTAVYLATILLLGTGWWLFAGNEGNPSIAARIAGLSDVDLHTGAGWVLAALGIGALLFGATGTLRFFAESLRFEQGDGAWLLRWPRAVFTGRFLRHEGHFDPGQRLANLVIVLLLVVLVASGIALIVASGGPTFVWALRAHKWATFLLTPILLGHVVVASGILPGYRGVWRSIHWRGELSEATARRLWPAWAEKDINRASTARPQNPHRQRD